MYVLKTTNRWAGPDIDHWLSKGLACDYLENYAVSARNGPVIAKNKPYQVGFAP